MPCVPALSIPLNITSEHKITAKGGLLATVGE